MITPTQLLANQVRELFSLRIRPRIEGPNVCHVAALGPSLWGQLDEAVTRGDSAGGGGSSGQRSTPPISTNVLALIQDIRQHTYKLLTAMVLTANEDLRWDGYEGPLERGAYASPHTNLKTLTRRLQAWPEATLELAHKVSLWVGAAEVALGHRQHAMRRLRGERCPTCTAVQSLELIDGHWTKQPTMRALWVGGYVQALACGECGDITELGFAWPEQARSDTP